MEKKTWIALLIGILCLAAAIAWLLFRDSSLDDDTAGEPSQDGESLSEELFAMDTVMDITLYRTDATDEPLKDIFIELRDCIYRMEKEFSVTDPGSEISKLNQHSSTGEWMTVSEDAWELISRAVEISEQTQVSKPDSPGSEDGSHFAFDPTLFPIVRLWGFTTGENRVPDEKEIQDTLQKVNLKNIEIGSNGERNGIRLLNGAEIDLGACAKGFLSDALSEIMRSHHVNGILSLGGNVQTVGTKPDGSQFVVGITDPSDGASLFATLESQDEAVITSGDYQRYFEKDGKRYHHIMDSRTGAPADSGLASVTVIGEKGVLCDAYATAFFVMGEEATKQFLSQDAAAYRVILIRKDGSYWASEELNNRVKIE